MLLPSDKVLNSSRAEVCVLTHLTVSTTSHPSMHVWKGVCHKHLQASQTNFWRARWMAVLEYVRNHTSLQYVALTDIGDTHLNPFNVSELIAKFASVALERRLLISTENTCWMGRVCTAADLRRFKTVFPDTGQRFMHSQYMGTREGVLHMLEWGASTNMTDDMHMIYEYALRHRQRIAFDTGQVLFGSFAVAQLDHRGRFKCWSGRCRAIAADCYKHERRVCSTVSKRTVCPALWHVNGPALLTTSCKDVLRSHHPR